MCHPGPGEALHVDGELGGLGEPKVLLHSAQASQSEASLPVAISTCLCSHSCQADNSLRCCPPLPPPLLPSVQRSTGWDAAAVLRVADLEGPSVRAPQ